MSKYAVVNPATGTLVKEYPTATDSEIQEALGSAQEAYSTWARKTSLSERVALARKAADLFVERKQELGAIIHREMGKPLAAAVGEAGYAGTITRVFADNAEEWLKDEPVDAADGLRGFVRKQGIGVILGIMPWNFPYYQVARFASPNLILGNTVIVKHANQCPESSAAIEQVFLDAGFPRGAYVNVYASHDQVSTIIADDRVQGVSLTGSERAGAIVAEQAGRHLKKTVLELGGSDPFIVLETRDVDHAVKQAVAGRMENSGQACNGSKRIIVLDSLFDEFAQKFREAMGALVPGEGDFGPLSSSGATATLGQQVSNAVSQGANVLVGGTEADGNFFPATVLTGITPEHEVFHEELFGPVAQLYRVSSEEEAVELANASPYGLGSIIIADDHAQAERVGNQLDTGMVFIGAAGLEGPDVPFGGVKRSGFGRELWKYGFEEFANKKLFRFAAQ